jgi:hypothetical protein
VFRPIIHAPMFCKPRAAKARRCLLFRRRGRGRRSRWRSFRLGVGSWSEIH